MRLLSLTVPDVSRIIALLAFVVLSFVSNACEKVPLLAPTGSTIFLTLPEEAQTMGLNSSMQVTAIVTEAGGTPPHNGTVVTFTTTLGHVDPVEARTTGGRASTTFFTGTRSGTATLRAFSGAAGTGDSTASATVNIGGAAENNVLALRVEGTSNNGRNTTIVAFLSDSTGNAIPGFTVSFSTDKGQLSHGLQVTDANGEARTTLTTSESATVTARAGAIEASIDITVAGSFNLTVTSPAPPTPAEVGGVVTFTLTPDADTIFNDVVIDFGDGQPQLSLGRVTAVRTFQHTFTQRGTFTVTARGTTTTGAPAQSSVIVQVNDRAGVAVTLTADLPIVTLTAQQGRVTFTATPTFPTNTFLSRVDWTFGDNSASERNTSLTNSHRYTATGTFTASVVVTTNDGRQGTSSIVIRVIAP